MVFNSFIFIGFFAVLALVMAATNLKEVKALLGDKLIPVRQWLLLAASYVFYSWWDWRFAFLLFGMTLVVYFCALGYTKTQNKLFVTIGVVIPLVVLGFFKYFNFFVSSFAALFGIHNAGTLKIILPLGISFYIFQALSYIIDVRRGKLQAEQNLARLALYVAFFPQVVSYLTHFIYIYVQISPLQRGFPSHHV